MHRNLDPEPRVGSGFSTEYAGKPDGAHGVSPAAVPTGRAATSASSATALAQLPQALAAMMCGGPA